MKVILYLLIIFIAWTIWSNTLIIMHLISSENGKHATKLVAAALCVTWFGRIMDISRESGPTTEMLLYAIIIFIIGCIGAGVYTEDTIEQCPGIIIETCDFPILEEER